jgi:antitoxin ParD1/3/4
MPVNVHLTPQLETLVQNKVKTGRYNSASEVIREALRLFEERDRIRELQIQQFRKKINKGWASLELGEGVDGVEFFRALELEEERELARKRKRA